MLSIVVLDNYESTSFEEVLGQYFDKQKKVNNPL